MALLFLTLSVIGLVPLSLGWALSKPASIRRFPRVQPGSVLLCALAFNLTFFWQELWLVIPKALTPGLHPVLFHNNHSWTGDRPVAELLQGTGAIATLASGLAFLGILAMASRAQATWRLFFFWMAFQGLSQSLIQAVIGAIAPSNDVGRAFAYLHLAAGIRFAVLAAAVVLLAVAGSVLAHAYPLRGEPRTDVLTRAFALEMAPTTLIAVAVIAPFRVPRSLIEVVIVPFFIDLIGVGWLIWGAALTLRGNVDRREEAVQVAGPALALIMLLLVFQFVLRPGIAFG